MQQTDRILTAFLTAISITVSFGLAFLWNLEKPFWAGFTALVISLATIGQSLQKSLLRIIGTIGGAIVGLGLLAQWEQSRWFILTVLSLYLMIMVFFIVRSNRNSYLFYTAVVVAMVIVLQTRAGEAPFMLAIARLEETLLGIVVYTVFALLFWPRSSVLSFQRKIAQLITVPDKLFARYATPSGQANSPDAREATELGDYRDAETDIERTVVLMPAVRLENYRIRRLSSQWDGFFTMLHTLLQTQRDFFVRLERASQSDAIIDLDAHLHSLGEQYAELARWRPVQSAALNKDSSVQSDDVPPPALPLTLAIDQSKLVAAEPGQRAMLETLRQEYEQQSQLCLALVDTLGFLTAGRDQQDDQGPKITQSRPVTLSQMRQVIMAGVQFWAIIMMWIYWNPPGVPTVAFAEMGVMISMVGFLAGTGKVEPLGLFLAFALGCIVATPFYFGIIPLMTSFSQLGVMIFVLVFVVCWLFHQQRLSIVRIGILLPCFNLSGLTNEHYFDPAMFFTGVLTLLTGIFIVALIFYLFGGGHPARQFLLRQQRFEHALAQCLTIPLEADSLRLSWPKRMRLVWNEKLLRETAPELVNLSFLVNEEELGQEKRSIKLLALSAFELTRLLPQDLARNANNGQQSSDTSFLHSHIWNAALDNYRANLAGVNTVHLDIRRF